MVMNDIGDVGVEWQAADSDVVITLLSFPTQTSLGPGVVLRLMPRCSPQSQVT